MIKIDLITGFLGSGKTTFIKKYTKYLLDQGENICILENDFGAINVDMMLLSDLLQDNCELEMVSGGCDIDCHKRRFKTKLISMGMCGYTRVIVEPSGIFDTDEFFDALKEEPLDRWYEIGSVITILDPAALFENQNENTRYLLASETANCGKILISKVTSNCSPDINSVISILNQFLLEIHCNRVIDESDIICKSWETFNESDYKEIKNTKYSQASYEKRQNIEEGAFESLFFMNKNFSKDKLIQIKDTLFSTTSFGNINRIKGFFLSDSTWYEFNSTKKDLSLNPVVEGQDVVIIIGSNMNKDKIEEYFK